MTDDQKFAELVPLVIRKSRLFVAAILDSKGNILYYTESLLHLFNESPPEEAIHYTDIIVKEDQERLREALTLCLIGKTVSSLQLQMQSRTNQPVQNVLWELSLVSSEQHLGGEALALCIGTQLPIGTVLVAIRPEGENEVIQNLMQRNKDLEQFTNIVAHNIRSPLANIMGLNRLLNLDLNESDRSTALHGINISAQKLDRVIHDLNEVLQVRKSQDLPKDEIVFESLVHDIESSISEMISDKHAIITYDFVEAPTIHSSRSYLQSIFQNIITNALKYSRDDVTPMLSIHSHMEGKYTVISFSDNGIGIDLKLHRDNIFGLYKRFSDHIEGKGLGLYMVKTQVEALGGMIDVESTPGEGTEFTVRLPSARI